MNACEPEQYCFDVKYRRMVCETAYEGVSADVHQLLCWVASVRPEPCGF